MNEVMEMQHLQFMGHEGKFNEFGANLNTIAPYDQFNADNRLASHLVVCNGEEVVQIKGT